MANILVADDDLEALELLKTVLEMGGHAVTTAASSEPDNGLGDGDTANDIQVSGNGSLNPVLNLRAERAGNGNGRTYTIKLRDNLKFHNGEPVRAQDCAPSLIRWARREAIGQTIWQYVDECVAQDDRTIKITLKRPIAGIAMGLVKEGDRVAILSLNRPDYLVLLYACARLGAIMVPLSGREQTLGVIVLTFLALAAAGPLMKLVGAVYELESGRVRFLA